MPPNTGRAALPTASSIGARGAQAARKQVHVQVEDWRRTLLLLPCADQAGEEEMASLRVSPSPVVKLDTAHRAAFYDGFKE